MKVNEFDVPPPGAGLMTVTLAVPAVAMSPAGMAAVSSEVLTKVVLRLEPFHRTVDSFTKFEPWTERVKEELPAVAEDGLSRAIVGSGLLMVKVTSFEVRLSLPLPSLSGLVTVTRAVPAMAISLAAMAAVSCVLLTKVVGRLAPFQFTCESDT